MRGLSLRIATWLKAWGQICSPLVSLFNNSWIELSIMRSIPPSSKGYFSLQRRRRLNKETLFGNLHFPHEIASKFYSERSNLAGNTVFILQNCMKLLKKLSLFAFPSLNTHSYGFKGYLNIWLTNQGKQ
jgi:hypothetical protein